MSRAVRENFDGILLVPQFGERGVDRRHYAAYHWLAAPVRIQLYLGGLRDGASKLVKQMLCYKRTHVLLSHCRSFTPMITN